MKEKKKRKFFGKNLSSFSLQINNKIITIAAVQTQFICTTRQVA